MTVALIVLASALAASVIANALSLRWGMKAKDGEVAATKHETVEMGKHALTKLELGGVEIELAQTKQALAIMTKRAETLAEELANERAKHALGTGLAPDDVRGRVQRLAAEAAAAGGAVPAEPAVIVSDSRPAATGETIAAAVRNLHPIDDLR